MAGVQGVETDALGIARAAADELERSPGVSVQAVLDRYVAREQTHFAACRSRSSRGRPTPAARR